MANLFDAVMAKFGQTALAAGRFYPIATSKMLEIASSSLRFSPYTGVKSIPS